MGSIEDILRIILDKIINSPNLIISLVALGVAFLSARIALQARLGNLYITLFEEYASPEMAEALRTLSRSHKTLKRYNGDQSKLAHREAVDDARRRVKYYFFKALRLKKAGFLPKELLKKIGAVYGINLLYDVVQELEKDKKAIEEIEEIKEICGRYKYDEVAQN
jgi:hypothetical protein